MIAQRARAAAFGLIGLAAVGLAAPVAAQTTAPEPAAAADPVSRSLILASGAPASAGNAVANALCSALNAATPLWCAVAPTGTVDATLAALQDGRAGFALLRADTVQVRGEGIQIIGALYDDVVTVIGRAGPPEASATPDGAGGEDFASLFGRRVNAGAPGTVPRTLWNGLEAAFAEDGAAFALRSELRAAEAGRAFCEGRVDGFMWLLTHPSNAVRDLLRQCGARMLNVRGPGVERLIASRADLRPVSVAGAVYESAEVASVGLPVLLVAGPAAAADDVAALAQAVLSNMGAISASHPAMSRLSAENILFSKLARPVHPSALEVYRAAGLTN